MSKYMKWELLDELRKKRYIFGVIAIVYLLVLIVPVDSSFMLYLNLPMVLILMGTFFLTFIAGAKRTMDSYQNKTFLLESMIPLSPNKILLAKYILGILANVAYCIIFILGLAAILAKADINLIKELLKIFYELEIDEWKILLRVFFLLLSSAVSFTAFTSLIFLTLKSFFPNMKGIKIVSFIISGILMNSISMSLIKRLIRIDLGDFYYSLLLLVLTVLCYFLSVWLVKNKLEIYS